MLRRFKSELTNKQNLIWSYHTLYKDFFPSLTVDRDRFLLCHAIWEDGISPLLILDNVLEVDFCTGQTCYGW